MLLASLFIGLLAGGGNTVFLVTNAVLFLASPASMLYLSQVLDAKLLLFLNHLDVDIEIATHLEAAIARFSGAISCF